jgi:hypothetical protein
MAQQDIAKMIRNTTGTSLTSTSLSGKLFFSKRQWRELRDQGRDRTFAMLFGGEEKEYTELVSYDVLKDSPEDEALLYEDAEFIGYGEFHHFTDERGRRYY